MKVLLTGGTGFVGLNIAEALLQAGHEVVAVDRSPPPKEALGYLSRLGPRIACQQVDVTDNAGLEAVFQGSDIDWVIQGAAITADAARERQAARSIFEVNLLGTINVLEAARRHGVTRLLYLSSSSVYGENATLEPWLDEGRTAALPDSLYAISKYAGERTALRHAALHGLDIVAARLSAVFGPWERDTGVRDTLSPIYQACRAARTAREVVLPRPIHRDWIYARDVGAGVVRLLEAPRPLAHQVFNLGPGEVWTVAEWCERLADRFGGFKWRLGADFTVDPHGEVDRSPLAIERLTAATGWHPAYLLDRAFEDYMSWYATLQTDI